MVNIDKFIWSRRLKNYKTSFENIGIDLLLVRHLVSSSLSLQNGLENLC